MHQAMTYGSASAPKTICAKQREGGCGVGGAIAADWHKLIVCIGVKCPLCLLEVTSHCDHY